LIYGIDRGPFGDSTIAEVPVDRAGRLPEAGRTLVLAADVVIWCTMAQRAWGLSEAQIVDSFSGLDRGRAILAVTRADYLRSDAARDKVLQRLMRQAGHRFAEIVAVDAGTRSAPDDASGTWRAAGEAKLRAAIDRALAATAVSDAPSDDLHAAWTEFLARLLAEGGPADGRLSWAELFEAIVDGLEAVAGGTSEGGADDPRRALVSRAAGFLRDSTPEHPTRLDALAALDVAVQVEQELRLPERSDPVSSDGDWFPFDPPDLLRRSGGGMPPQKRP
jgi:hypothetical protein